MNKIKKFFQGENEFTKKWIARFTIVIFIVLLFLLVLAEEILFFHFTKGLSFNMSKMLLTTYASVVKVAITGYVSFAAKKKAASTGRNPRTGEPVTIPARTAVTIKAGSKLKEALN